MNRINELKKIMIEMLKPICEVVSYENAIDTEMYPHITFQIISTAFDTANKQTHMIDIDIWDNGPAADIDDLMENVIRKCDYAHIVTDKIMLNIYVNDARVVEETEKNIKHRVVSIDIQNYTKKDG